jgi:hypothetical protein
MLAGAAGYFQHDPPIGKQRQHVLSNKGFVVFARLRKWERFDRHLPQPLNGWARRKSSSDPEGVVTEVARMGNPNIMEPINLIRVVAFMA